MRNHPRHSDFAKAAAEQLEHAAQNLPAADQRQLVQARQMAIKGVPRKAASAAWHLPWAWPVGGLATAALLALILWWPAVGGLAPQGGERLAGLEDLEILVAGEQVDFYADLDFYLWLAEQGDAS